MGAAGIGAVAGATAGAEGATRHRRAGHRPAKLGPCVPDDGPERGEQGGGAATGQRVLNRPQERGR